MRAPRASSSPVLKARSESGISRLEEYSCMISGAGCLFVHGQRQHDPLLPSPILFRPRTLFLVRLLREVSPGSSSLASLFVFGISVLQCLGASLISWTVLYIATLPHSP